MFRTRHFLCCIAALCITTFSAHAQARLVEKVTRKPGQLIIPYEKYVLPNGLTVIVHEDHSDPLVHVDVTYHVGSAREQIGKSGFAHFFEHMMFQGSDNVADEELIKIVSEGGGTNNGTTNRDRTNYFETVPNNQLEKMLWLEADRMGFLLDAVTQQKFEIQRATVKNERGQSYDNRQYGLMYEKTSAALYPYGHPYSWMTIGYLEDLNKGNVNDLKNFFLRWYGPNNAVLTVGGDVKPAQVVKLAEKYFGPIKRGPAVSTMKLPAPVLTADRYVSYEDNVRFPRLLMTFPTVPAYHPDEVPLDVLAEILGQGKNSILYKNLTKPQKSLLANASHPCAELAGEFSIDVVPSPGHSLAEMEKIVRDAFDEFEKTGVSDEVAKRIIATRQAQIVNQLASVSGKVSNLASYLTLTGNANYYPKDLKRYQSVTKADVMRVFNTYIKGKHAVILSVYPKGKPEEVAHADNYKVDASNYKAPKDEYSGLKYVKAKDNFNRKKQPAAGPNPVVKLPVFWQSKTANGITIMGAKSDEIPAVTLLLSTKGGHLLEPVGKAGIASLTAQMLGEASEHYTAEELSTRLGMLGSSISFSSNASRAYVSVYSFTKNLDPTLALLEERLFHPRFDKDDFDRLKKQRLEQIKNQQTDASALSQVAFLKALYGEGNFMGISPTGTVESVSAITLDDVKAYYKANYSPMATNLVVVGDIDQAAITPKLSFLKKWQGADLSLPKIPAGRAVPQTQIFLVNKDKAPQSEIRLGYLALPYDATGDYYKAGLMNYVLGEAFNSRLNLKLREEKGYTYGAGSYFTGSEVLGYFIATAGVRANVTDSAVYEFMSDIRLFREQGITDQELAFVKSAIGQSKALKYETALQKAYFLDDIARYKLDPDFITKQNEILKNITKAEINALAKKYLPIENMVIVVVGDKASIKPGLEKLGYPITELDMEGRPVK
nr:pitrilysin family protein [uncultured Mucilaginibacter sp.]